MVRIVSILVLACASAVWAQSPSSSPASAPAAGAPRPARVDASTLPDGESSSKDSQVDLSPPPEDIKAHPNSALEDAGSGKSDALPAGTADVKEFHPWDPHKAAKDVEVGDFYFKRKNYRAAEDRYREALLYKDNDAIATYRLAVCLEKLDRPNDALQTYQSYLKILPFGPEADHAKKAIERLKSTAATANSPKK